MKTVSLETARKLKEAGYPQYVSSETYQYSSFLSGNNRYDDTSRILFVHEQDSENVKWFSAPCACEILEQLPKQLKKNKQFYEFVLRFDEQEKHWFCGYFCMDWDYERWEWLEIHELSAVAHDKSLAEACAELWLWAKKEGYVK